MTPIDSGQHPGRPLTKGGIRTVTQLGTHWDRGGRFADQLTAIPQNDLQCFAAEELLKSGIVCWA
jgi:hypothetical protein